MKRITFFALCFVVLATSSFAQGVSSLGTDFWVGFMPNFNVPATDIGLHIASGTDNKVLIEYYAGSTDGKPTATRSVTLKKDEALTLKQDAYLVENWDMEKTVYMAVHVTSQFPIALYGTSNGGATADGYLALPTPGLGKEYYAACFYDDRYLSFPWPLAGEFMIIAPYDGTTVTIKTTANTRLDLDGLVQGHKQGDTWSVTLRKGQCYLVQSSGLEFGDHDLTGSHITSNKPIAFLTGHQRCSVPVGEDVDSKDHLIEMMPPLDKWGTEYYERSYYSRPLSGDYIRLLSGEDGNTISINGNQTISLNAGEYNDRPLTIGTEVYKSVNNKKFLALQYVYSEGHNGDPLKIDPDLIILTPQRQFQKKIIFRTIINPADPQSAEFKNIITVICRADSIDNILLNGQKITTKTVGTKEVFLNTNPQMASRYVFLGSGQKTYIATSNEPMGIYLYGYTNVEGYGFPAGMALTIETPDTLPPLAAPLENCGDYDVVLREPRLAPNPFDDTKIIEIALITEPADLRLDKSVSKRPSVNYTLSFSNDFEQNGVPKGGEPDSNTTIYLRVIDKLKDAFASVWTTDLAGNDTVYEYSYIAPKISPATDTLSFEPTLVGTDSCRTFVVRNLANSAPLTFTDAILLDTALYGKFTISPDVNGETLAPGDSFALTVCYTPDDTLPSSLDLLTLKTACLDYPFPLRGIGVTPLIYADDLDFGTVDSGKSKCLPLRIKNPGKYTLVIDKQDLLNTPDFSVGANVTFPIIIPPGGQVTIDYCYHPTTYGTHTATSFFTTRNPLRFLHSIKDTSNLRGRALKPGAKWHLFSYDFGKVNCLLKPTVIDTLFNDEEKDQEIERVEIIGPDATSFRIVGVTPPTLAPPYATVLQTRASGFQGYAFEIEFDPNVKTTPGPANAMLVAYQKGVTEGSKQPTTFLYGEQIAPALTLLPNPATVDLGTTVASGQLTGQFEVQNTGSDMLRVTSISSASPDAPLFALAPQPPFDVAPGASQIVNVTFNAPPAPGTFTATFDVSPEACAVQLPITILAQSVSTAFVPQGADYPLTFVCKTRDTSLASFTNLSSNETVTLESVTIDVSGTWTNVNDFILLTPWTPQPIAPNGGTVIVPIRFIPQAPGLRQAGLFFIYRRASGDLDTLVKSLTGLSDAIQRVAGVGNTTTGGSYVVTTNEAFQIPLVLNAALAPQTTEAYYVEFTVSWQRDLLDKVTFNPPAGNVNYVLLSQSPVTDVVESRKYRISNTAIGVSTLSELGSLTGQMMVAKDTVSAVTLSDVTFLDRAMQPTLCYIETQEIPGVIRAQDVCGDKSLREWLNGRSIFEIDAVETRSGIAAVKFTTLVRSGLWLEVVNALGAIVKKLPANVYERGSYTIQVPVSDLAGGLYFVRLTDGTTSSSDKFILSR